MTLQGMNFLNYSAMKFVKCLLFALSLCSLVALTGCDLPFKLPFDLPFGKEDPVVVSVGKVNLTQSKLLSMVPNWNSLDDRTRLERQFPPLLTKFLCDCKIVKFFAPTCTRPSGMV